MMRILVTSISFVLAFCAVPAVAQLSNVGHVAVVSLDGRIGTANIDQFKDAGGNGPGIIAAGTTFSRTVGDGNGNSVAVNGSSNITATLITPGSGSILFDQALGVSQQLVISTSANLDGAIRGFGTYTYGFTTASAARFLFTYDVSSFGQTPALTTPTQFGFLKEDNSGDFAFISDQLGDGAHGSLTALIGPGTYSFNIQDFYVNQADTIVASAGLTGRYGFAVSAVPEPTTWAMMISGFGIIGGVMRRRTITATFKERRRQPI